MIGGTMENEPKERLIELLKDMSPTAIYFLCVELYIYVLRKRLKRFFQNITIHWITSQMDDEK